MLSFDRVNSLTRNRILLLSLWSLIDIMNSRITCMFCGRAYIYSKSFFTHLRNVHGERVGTIAWNTLPDEGYIFEDGFILIPEQDQPEIDFDEDEEPDAPDAGSTSSDEENDQPWTEAVQPSASHSTELRSEGLNAKQPRKSFDGPFLLLDEESTGWSPFSSEREYRFAEWVVKNRITKTAVDSLLKLDANQPFTSSLLLFKRINDMTYDLGMQTWKTGKVSFMRSNAGGLPSY